MYGWAPLAIMGEEINKSSRSISSQAYSSIAQDDSLELSGLQADPGNNTAEPDTTRGTEGASIATAGVYLGIWNIFATIPQFLATFIAMVAFSILEPGQSPELTKSIGEDGENISKKPVHSLSGTGVCLAIGAVCSFVAAFQTLRLPRN